MFGYGPLKESFVDSCMLAAAGSGCAEASKHRSPSMQGQEYSLSPVEATLWMAIGGSILRKAQGI